MRLNQAVIFFAFLAVLSTALEEKPLLDAQERTAAFIGYQEKQSTATATFKSFVLTTSFGQIRIRPRQDLAPKIVDLVLKLSKAKECKTCRFYRHEPAPENFGKDGFFGPPYALLQGSLADMDENPPFEETPPAKRGDVCLIPNSKEFFISTMGHEEWGHAHSVWGRVDDAESWAVIGRIPMEPYTNRTSQGFTTRWLAPNVTVPFQLSTE